MKDTTEIRTIQFLQIYDSLSPANRARLVEQLKALLQNQAAAADSPQKEKRKV